MTEPRIIVAESHGHWNAWFEDRPFETFGGDTPGTAVERLWEAELNNRAVARSRTGQHGKQ
ncbi:hypothetical protein Pan44_50840 [Caulifigura coniformis]|uniref:Uncharacterized protein n=1 Tax=Caulifigura coniformis TaxID=2527983 RepID=A0A517SLL7_9PLAN|nr:hypothetical protein [Caulifigura coniformis]QDT57019.1 hypothetical protein Pan44_50840 [Caulifigura coniformis]